MREKRLIYPLEIDNLSLLAKCIHCASIKIHNKTIRKSISALYNSNESNDNRRAYPLRTSRRNQVIRSRGVRAGVVGTSSIRRVYRDHIITHPGSLLLNVIKLATLSTMAVHHCFTIAVVSAVHLYLNN